MEALQLEKKKRSFLPEDITIDKWETIQAYYDDLVSREIPDLDSLKKWLEDRSELESIVSENFAWRYIRMTCDTASKEHSEAYSFFVKEIQPKIAPYSDKLNKKYVASPFVDQLQGSGYFIMNRSIKKAIEIYREENIPLFTEVQTINQEYSSISGAQTVEIDGQELTMQQAAVLLQSTDRSKREDVWKKITERRAKDKGKLDELFSKLVKLRHQIAQNAGFKNFRDYMFAAMGRFDYTVEDCFDFHDAIKSEVLPLAYELSKQRKEKLGVTQLRPWDKAVDPEGREALKPFSSPDELTNKSIENFKRSGEFLGQCLATMKEMKHLDLDSRKGKAPGGYNYPLAETGVPFIFMNATSTLRDLVTLMHEGGHAVHSIVTRDLELGDFKETPSEVAELASMSMELISMDHWDLFFKDEDLKRAKTEHLEQVIETLPWIAIIDKFQHWIYENPEHSIEEREEAWLKIYNSFTDDLTDWSGVEENKKFLWHRQLHLFEVPFYYIEYGFAQLGAIAVWKNYKENNEKGIEGYLNALKLGYTKTIPEIYETANIKFDFSKEYIKGLFAFLDGEMKSL